MSNHENAENFAPTTQDSTTRDVLLTGVYARDSVSVIQQNQQLDSSTGTALQRIELHDSSQESSANPSTNDDQGKKNSEGSKEQTAPVPRPNPPPDVAVNPRRGISEPSTIFNPNEREVAAVENDVLAQSHRQFTEPSYIMDEGNRNS